MSSLVSTHYIVDGIFAADPLMKIETIRNTDSDLHGRVKEIKGGLRCGAQQDEPYCIFSDQLSASTALTIDCMNVTKGGYTV